MKLISIEPTPSPNSMKLNLDERLPGGVRRTYTAERCEGAPEFIRRLLGIPGVVSVYHTADFIALDRQPKGDWERILAAAREALGDAGGMAPTASAPAAEQQQEFGEVHVLVQTIRRIPMQVRVRRGGEEQRSAMPERFVQAAMEAGRAATNLIAERRLEERGVRYGELADVLAEVVRELDAAYDDARLAAMVEEAVRMDPAEAASIAAGQTAAEAPRRNADPREVAEALRDPDWRKRYAALQQLQPTEKTIPLLEQALDDPQMSIRRLAAVYLGDIKGPLVLPVLFRALKDDSVAVRRTAGDTLSDLGDPAAIPAMAGALRDPNKLVRWRAARFLYETGDESALPALLAAQEDAEFEVRMQIRMAIERIQGGEEAGGSVWQQMTNRKRD